MKKFFRSLLAKYMLIILTAIFIVQIAYLFIALFIIKIDNNLENSNKNSPELVEEKWHTAANNIKNDTNQNILNLFDQWKKNYPEASMFWIDQNGNLSEKVNVKRQIPNKWDSAYTAKFMKESYASDPFTVIAFVGKDTSQGFVVLQIPRNTFNPPLVKANEKYGTLLTFVMLGIIILFITISFFFFRGIRKRLLHLQDAMTIRDVDQLPIEIQVKKKDEIGQLEQTFNQMVVELRESKQREQKEEQLRRELIANLSHDLRTPLTKIRAQTFTICKEELSQEGKQAVKALEKSVINIDHLVENLMSYTLLMSSKYKFDPFEVDVVRLIRECIASWYPVFEKTGFTVDVELQPFENHQWHIDPIWLGRILDNLLQNVLRHAKDGLYVGVKTESTVKYDAIVISDHGKGMNAISNEKGAGIGLSIVDLMINNMQLEWNIESSEKGTTIKIKKYK
ncbi:sensor histidine kinase [Rummeliibacillus pycnus]|uniref:HAMP domain-containing sensor histidine kinase n=1 Tax=Rummeliibacillus pycnus TaxID=101070 RepID=UPI003D2DCB0F